MDIDIAPRYFLGANSGNSFFSLYDSLTDPAAGDFLWIIKGGPGCGKSSFMRRIAEAARKEGFAIEYIHCSGDPDSLDGVWFPEKGLAYVDGTAPHAMEAKFPGLASMYLDLGRFYDHNALRCAKDEVYELDRQYKALYSTAYKQLSAAAAFSAQRCPELWGAEQLEKTRRRAEGFAHREFRGASGGGHVSHRFLSAYSCKGRLSFSDTVSALCRRVCSLDNEYGLAWVYLEHLSRLAADAGLDITLCHDPLFPDRTEALLIPSLSLGLLAGECAQNFSGDIYRHMRLDALVDSARLNTYREALRRSRKSQALLLSGAIHSLSSAKTLHDRLEGIYNPHVDFDGVYREADRHAEWLLS